MGKITNNSLLNPCAIYGGMLAYLVHTAEGKGEGGAQFDATVMFVPLVAMCVLTSLHCIASPSPPSMLCSRHDGRLGRGCY